MMRSKLKILLCGLGCIHIAPYPPPAHAR